MNAQENGTALSLQGLKVFAIGIIVIGYIVLLIAEGNQYKFMEETKGVY